MPYIAVVRRQHFEPALKALGQAMATIPDLKPGDLNYLITRLATEYMQIGGLSYKNINDVLGAAEGAKLEFYRRLAAPFEDTKIASTGDVYPPLDAAPR